MSRHHRSPAIFVCFMSLGLLVACGGAPGDPSDQAAPPASADLQGDEVGAATAHAPDAAGEPSGDDRFGPALPEPELYYGLYASPEEPNRTWFIAEAKRPPYAEHAPEVPPGHLALGAMFGDVAPWNLKTVSTTRFEQAWVPERQAEPIAIELELGADGAATAFRFTSEAQADLGRLERVGDLPDGM